MIEIDPRHYERVVELWPVAGWLTGGLSALTLWLASLVFDAPVAALLALTSRTLFTGALHEDGLADFADGMGGGTSRERILAIMKIHTSAHTESSLLPCIICWRQPR